VLTTDLYSTASRFKGPGVTNMRLDHAVPNKMGVPTKPIKPCAGGKYASTKGFGVVYNLCNHTK
jgi:hypothetical protein